MHESGDGSDTQMRFNVSLRDARSQQPTVTVEYRTVDGTATAGSDYTATSGTLTFAPGEKRKQVLVPVKDDPIDDDGETFELVLENPTDARLDPERSRATGTIHNNGAPRLSATFPSSAFASRSHTGADDRPQVIVEFSEAVAAFGENTPSVSVGNGAVETVQAHTEDGLDHAYVFFLAPDGDEDVRFTLVPNAACGAGGICTTAGLELGDVPGARTIPGPEDSDPSDASVLSVNDAEASEENDSTIDFVVELDPASSESVTVDYETADGTAGAGDDYTAKSGTLTFSPGDTRKTVSVPIVDDAVEDDNETLTLTLGNASGAEIDDAEATGTIRDDDQAASTPLTASFRNMPAEHDGDAAFSFEVEFSEDVGTSYRTLRDDSFTVTNGDVTGARRVDGRHDLWEITVEPDSDEAVTITLPGDRECGTTGAVCTRGDDPQPLSNSPSATVAGPEEPAQTNTEAAGAPTISGTAQVDKTLTASVSDISDADGLDDASFDYQWVRGSADIAGATDSSYTLVSADEGERIKVRVSFTDDAGNAESLTSAATDAVAAAPQPLTASFSGMPAEHDGSTEFTFELHFSEDVKAGYERIRDDAFSISGGNINQARRQTQGSNQSWEIKVRPSGGDRITITLPETTSCSSTGAICTEDGRKLSHSTADSVSGPVGISVGDARVQEGDGAVLAFLVTLSRAAGGSLSVDYATSDGTAQAGTDYTAKSGTLTFGTGQTSQTIEVAVLDDAHDEGEETLTLTLSNPSGAVLTNATATGTIENHDAMPAALIARFGRTAAVHIVEQVEERISAPRQPGVDARVAGRRIGNGNELQAAVGILQQLSGTGYGSRQPGMNPQQTNRAPGNAVGLETSQPQGGLGTNGSAQHGMQRNALRPARPGMHNRMGMRTDMLLRGSGFALNRETRNGGVLSFWSRQAQSQFHGTEGLINLNGDVRTSMFGADYSKGRLMTGVSLAHSRGAGSYAGVDNGQLTSAVTGLYPWVGYKVSERVTVWGLTGYGAGGMLLSPGGNTPIETSLSMAMGAAGTRGELVDGGAGGFDLAFKADALWVGTSIAGTTGPGGNLADASATVTRLRTGIETSRRLRWAGRVSVTPSIELGIRQDGGDAENGAGIDVGAGLVMQDGKSGLRIDLRVRTLLVHQAEGFSERGVSVAVSYNPTPSTPLGLSARVTPAWGGNAASGAEALWSQDALGGMNHHAMSAGKRFDAELGYGLPVGARLVGTPRVGLRTSEHGRDYRVGYGMQVLEQGRLNLQLGIDAERRESPVFHLQEGSEGTDQRVIGRATVQW